MQEAISQVGKVVAAREAATRAGSYLSPRQDHREALVRVEQEIRALGGTVPRSFEEAQHLLQSVGTEAEPGGEEALVVTSTGEEVTRDENLTTMQQRLAEQRDAAQAAASQVNQAMEKVAALRQEQQRLEEQRKNEGWDDFEATLRKERIAIEDRQHQIASLAGQEGLPIPGFFAPLAREQFAPLAREQFHYSIPSCKPGNCPG